MPAEGGVVSLASLVTFGGDTWRSWEEHKTKNMTKTKNNIEEEKFLWVHSMLGRIGCISDFE